MDTIVDGMRYALLTICGFAIFLSILNLIEEDHKDTKRKLIIKENNKILNEDNIHSLSDIQKKIAREYLSNPENATPLTLKMVKKMDCEYNQQRSHEEFLKNEKIKLEKQRSLLLNNDN